MYFPNGCHIAKVETDPETGAVEILHYTLLGDAGCLVDHASVEGQGHGCVM